MNASALQFFNAQRRRTHLKDWSPKRNNESEKRILLNLEMALTGSDVKLTGIPEFVNDGFLAIEKQHAQIEKVILDAEVEGITLEVYDTDEAKRRCQLIVGATLRQFRLERIEDITYLKFNTTIPRGIDVLKFAHEYEGNDVFILFDATQAKLIFPSEEDESQNKLFTNNEQLNETADQKTSKEVGEVARNWGTKGKAAKGR